MTDIDPRLQALLGTPERTVQARHDVPGLLEEATPESLHDLAEDAIAVHAAGEALRQARQHRELSLRGAAQLSGRSAPRIKAIEATDSDIHLATVVAHARALGYGVQLTLTPLDGQGPSVHADLSPQDTDAPTVARRTRLKRKVTTS